MGIATKIEIKDFLEGENPTVQLIEVDGVMVGRLYVETRNAIPVGLVSSEQSPVTFRIVPNAQGQGMNVPDVTGVPTIGDVFQYIRHSVRYVLN